MASAVCWSRARPRAWTGTESVIWYSAPNQKSFGPVEKEQDSKKLQVGMAAAGSDTFSARPAPGMIAGEKQTGISMRLLESC